MSTPHFAREIMPLIDRLFAADEVRVETTRSDPGDPSTNLADVRITHIPGGEVVECAKHYTQIENKVEAALELRLRLDTR